MPYEGNAVPWSGVYRHACMLTNISSFLSHRSKPELWEQVSHYTGETGKVVNAPTNSVVFYRFAKHGRALFKAFRKKYLIFFCYHTKFGALVSYHLYPNESYLLCFKASNNNQYELPKVSHACHSYYIVLIKYLFNWHWHFQDDIGEQRLNIGVIGVYCLTCYIFFYLVLMHYL